MDNFTKDKKREDADFEKRIKKIVDNAEQIRKEYYCRKFIKRFTLLISGIFLLSLITKKDIYAIRVPGFDYFVEYCNQYDKLSLISPEDEQNSRDKILQRHVPGNIPKGYKRWKVSYVHDVYETVYRKRGKEQLVFYQYTEHQKSRVDIEKSLQYEQKRYRDRYYYVRKRDRLNSIVWYFDGYQYQIIGDEPISSLLKMAESLI